MFAAALPAAHPMAARPERWRARAGQSIRAWSYRPIFPFSRSCPLNYLAGLSGEGSLWGQWWVPFAAWRDRWAGEVGQRLSGVAGLRLTDSEFIQDSKELRTSSTSTATGLKRRASNTRSKLRNKCGERNNTRLGGRRIRYQVDVASGYPFSINTTSNGSRDISRLSNFLTTAFQPVSNI
jgi:hypothetical protein